MSVVTCNALNKFASHGDVVSSKHTPTILIWLIWKLLRTPNLTREIVKHEHFKNFKIANSHARQEWTQKNKHAMAVCVKIWPSWVWTNGFNQLANQRSTKPRFVGTPATCKVAKCSHSDCENGQHTITSVFQTECEENRKISATKHFRPEWTKLFAFFLKFARFLQNLWFWRGNCTVGDTDKRHWFQRKSCSFLMCVSLRRFFFWQFSVENVFFVGICARVKRPFRGIPRNSRGIRATVGPCFKHWPFFSTFCRKNRVSSFFRPFWPVSTPNFPNPPPNDKKRLKAPTGANQKKDTFWPVECQKTQTKMRTNTENHQVCVFPPASHRMKQVEWFRHLDMTSQRALLWIGWQKFWRWERAKHVIGDPSNEVVWFRLSFKVARSKRRPVQTLICPKPWKSLKVASKKWITWLCVCAFLKVITVAQQ